MASKATGLDEIRRGLWLESKGTQSLRGQGNEEEPEEIEKEQP
jgi:hypothetical protein